MSTPREAAAESDSHHDRAIGRGHLALRSAVGPYGIRIQEVSGRSDKRVEPRGWHERGRRAAWLDARRTEFVSTGVLELVVDGPGMAYSGTRYRDAKTIRLEEKLPRLFRAIEVQRLYAEWREEERQREAADRQRRWEVAMAEARRQYESQARWDDFRRRTREWHELTEQRAFLAALRAVVSAYSGPSGTSWWGTSISRPRRLDEIDPLMHPESILPDVPDPKPDDLKPFLDGWSPHGPEATIW